MNPTAKGAAASARPDAPELGPRLATLLLPRARGGDPALLRASIEQLCLDRDHGHVCLQLAELAGRSRRAEGADDGPAAGPTDWPALDAWRTALRASGLCHVLGANGALDADFDTEAPLPLVLDAQSRLYLRRDFTAERTIARWLLPRLQPLPIEAGAVRTALQALDLHAPAERGDVDWQLAAIAAAARAPFLLLTGGPGTGKTTTVARLLGVLRQLEPGLRIAIAAPTGKAAARLGEALQQRAAAQPALAGLLHELVPTTLHRLLGYLPHDDSFRRGPGQPLPFDLVVVDEASMVDPTLLAVLCAALLPAARLLLVGDRDQLAAVAAGQVLGDLCRAARPERGCGPGLATFVQAVTGMAVPVQNSANPIADCVIALRTNHRFGQQPGIGAFARALAERQPDAALLALQHGHADLQLVADGNAALGALAEPLLAAAAAARGEPEAALRALATLRVLTATRHGPMGAVAWNQRIEAWLGQRAVRVEQPWYPGRPILVTTNDHQNRIWNGDLGVVWLDGDGRAVVLFPNADGSVRKVPPLRLPAHETAWAMTVHKAQGSEFDHVLLAMPEREGPLWQASLIYTGITRARRRALLLAEPALLRAGLGHWPARASGLAAALGGA
ncbi:MAG: exodeoxyribonuclease V subunit alpha [Planctomycetes bacterium]|jgi:exodeoxyribonuclease V alpha subunit|nr:exodeoxyribonuclease V subunit alpha [Planctomycetota bacterium]